MTESKPLRERIREFISRRREKALETDYNLSRGALRTTRDVNQSTREFLGRNPGHFSHPDGRDPSRLGK
jgi:hypothetical protein